MDTQTIPCIANAAERWETTNRSCSERATFTVQQPGLLPDGSERNRMPMCAEHARAFRSHATVRMARG